MNQPRRTLMGVNHKKEKKGEPSCVNVKDVPIPGTHPGAAGTKYTTERK